LFAAVFNLAVHSLIGHKEYRFIELTSATLVLLAAIGSISIIHRIEWRRRKALPEKAVLAAILSLWFAASAWLGQGRPLDQWFGKHSSGPELVHAAGSNPQVCGLGSMMVEYWQLSRAYLGRPMPIVLLKNTPRPFPRLAPPGPELASVNAVIAPTGSEALLPGYMEAKCKGGEPYRRCLYVRPGTCRPTAEAREREIQKILSEVDM
jgi:hypothetical protein